MAQVELDTVVSVPAFAVKHGFTTTALGSMGLTNASEPDEVMRRRQELADEIGFDLQLALMTVQEHGAKVAAFHRERPEGGQCVFSTDALATDLSGQAIVTYHADCFPVLFVAPARGVVAAAHAGWRGTLAGVAAATVRELNLAYGVKAEDLRVLIGPGICVSCYPVGEEIAGQFASLYGEEERYLQRGDGAVRLDLAAALHLQLSREGVNPEHISSMRACTREQARWFSHRGGRPGRFLAVIVAP